MNIKSLFKNRWVKWPLEILFFVLLYLVLHSYMQRNNIAGLAPNIQATTLDQQRFDLHAESRKPVLVHFWATWCGICRLEQDSIDALSKDYNVITIAMQSGTDDEVKTFLKKNQLGFKVINDSDDELVRLYGITSVPASFVINSQNEINFSEVGFTSAWGLRLRLWFTG